MAKGNLFQGMARGKVGDVVFYRMNGWQMSRVRNRKPKNPRTPEQMYQRAIIATVMKSYSAGKEIFDHSFQDYRFGEDNMRRYNSLNAIYLRNLIKQEIENRTDETESNVRVVGYKSPSCVANPGFIVSEGSLVNDFLTVNTGVKTDQDYPFKITMPEVKEGETLNTYFKRLGIYNDDIFTIVAFLTTDEVVSSIEGISSPYSKQNNTKFAWLRIKMTGNLNQEVPAESVKFNDLITTESNNNGLTWNPSGVPIGSNFGLGSILSTPEQKRLGTIAIIRSKNNTNLRSTEQMKWISTRASYNTFGITTEWILDAWMKEKDTLGQSELILEGGEGQNAYSAMSLELNDDIEIETESKKRKK